MTASFRGGGWGLGPPMRLSHPLEVISVPPDAPRELARLLSFLDEIATSGDPSLLAAGFLSYEAGVWLEGSESLFRPPTRTPLAAFALFDLRDGSPLPEPSAAGSAGPRAGRGAAASSLDLFGWERGVVGIRDGIARGDVYQVNLTRRVTFPETVDAPALAARLHADNPVPYALTLAAGGWAVVSNSPELFLDADLARGTAASAPIKGTRRVERPGGPRERAEAEAGLLASTKDAAEHVMIVDLVRNDLGRVAVPGGVRVAAGSLAAPRHFTHLVHLESTVEARLAEGTRPSYLLRAALPGGSVTGAPKRAALGFIRRLEPVARGPYTGVAGYVRGDGRVVLNIAIRTAIVSPGAVEWHTGGGIVWDSSPAAEWEETVTKSLEFERSLP